MWLKFYIFGIICGLFYTNNFTKAANNIYFGTKIGPLSQLHHGVSGEVYAVDSRTLFLKNFNYDGEGPAAYFYVGNTRRPGNQGAFRVRDERGSTGVIKRYRNKDITLTLPEGKTLRDVKWFSVWCDEFSVNFGDVTIPKNLDFPRPHKINALNGVHGVSSDNIVIVDAQTVLIPNFSYDGEAPDAKFWVGHGGKPTPQGIRIPDENGKETPLRRYDKKTIVLTLPGDLTIFDIGHFGVWCEAFTVDFGHVRIPDAVNVPPSLKMLGISPQSKLNCEVLFDDLAYEVRWAVAGESIVVQLVAKLEPLEYMSFGVSPNLYHTEMVGADVAVAWIDRDTGKGFSVDYYLDDKSQCSGVRGSCPDTRFSPNSNSIRLLNSAIVNGYSIITYQRPLKASDKYDIPIQINGSQAIVWAVGPLNQRSEVSYHSKYTKGDRYIDFGRQPFWNCPFADGEKPQSSEAEPVGPFSGSNFQGDNAYLPTTKRPIRRIATPQPAAKDGAWEIPPIQCFEPEDGVFYAQMGPTGGKHGYPAITGHVGWGISWYINGLLIPEINVVRGKTYTFVVEGGIDPEIPAKYHPFYITDDSVGGYEHKTDQEKAQVKIYAGVQRKRNGQVTPTGVGRLCNWTPDPDGPPSDEYNSFGAYQRSLTLKCDDGEPGVVSWTPDKNTPDTVYYQCFTHRYLGWRINVHDSCDDEAQASEIEEIFVAPEEDADSFVAEPSIRHESKLRPNENVVLAHEKEPTNIHFVNEPQKNTNPELQNESEISKLIADGIKAAEELEKSIAIEGIIDTTTTQTASPNLNRGEIDEILTKQITHLPEQEIHVPYDRPVLPTPTGELSVYLKPPQNFPNSFHIPPNFRPVKLPLRRPISLERRPIQIARPQRPVIIPQPSMIVNHYKRPVSPFIRPFVKTKTVPIKSIASVLLLGEPTEIPSIQPTPQPQTQPPQPLVPNHNYNNNFQKPIPQKQPTFINTSTFKKKPELPVLYPQKEKKPQPKPQYFDKLSIIDLQHQKPPPTSNPIFEYKADVAPASQNHGFQPDSVIVESGFRPIVRRGEELEEDYEEESKSNRRQDENVSEIDDSNEGETLFISSETQNKYFEPMFVPSPLDSVTSAKLKSNTENNHKERLTGDLIDMDVEDGEDKMAVAAERQDIYYLPPDNRNKIQNQVYPEGTVVAYDGKAVLDTSLVNSAPSNVASNIYADVSRTETLIRNTPQFVPFRGEIPPLSPDFMQDTVQFSINRNLNGPKSPVTEYFNPLSNTKNGNIVNTARPISTKLTLLKSTDGSSFGRRKRAAHHTPDHHEYPSLTMNGTTKVNHTDTGTRTKSNSVEHLYSHLLIISCMLVTKMYKF